MISSEEYNKRLKDAVEVALASGSPDLDALIREHLSFGLKNYAELAPDAKVQVDAILGMLLRNAEEKARALDDGPPKRKTLRDIALLRDEHFTVKRVFESLGQKRDDRDHYVDAAEVGVLEILQEAADVMYDARTAQPRGRESFLKAALLVGAVDDVLCAVKLTGRGLATQAATLLRDAQEKCELVELFLHHPQFIDAWMDERRRWRELKPSQVRVLLGRKGVDISYKFLSEIGVHPSFASIKVRSARVRPAAEHEAPEHLSLWVGGQMLPWALIPLCIGALYRSSLVLLLAIEWMQQRVVAPENAQRVERADALIAAFKAEHAKPKMRDMGFSEEEVAALLDEEEGPGTTEVRGG